MTESYVEGIDYKFIIPDEVSENIDIKLLVGQYKDIVYRYGGVSIDEDEVNGAVLSFNYDIIESNDDPNALENDEDFKNHIGNILVTLIEKRLKSETEEV